MKLKYISIIALSFSLAGCEKSLDLEVPKGKYTSEAIFSTDDLAIAAVRGIYLSMVSPLSVNPFQAATSSSFSLLSDEFIRATYSDLQREFFENNITSGSSLVASHWNSHYNYILQANMILENAGNSESLSPAVRRDVMAEARFVRAISYFYLTNIYGAVPLLLSSDYAKNSLMGVSPQADIYKQIIEDLLYAQENMLGNTTAAGLRHRPSRWSATALLARVYLYQKNWAAAEQAATTLISKSSIYKLERLENVFLRSSQEAIWAPNNNGSNFNTPVAIELQGAATANSAFLFSPYTLSRFDANDQRKITWTKTIGTTTAPYKYKQYSLSAGQVEAVMVLRLAEQYLIRAEARAMQGNLTEAITDIDAIRLRAGAVADNIGANASNTFKTIGFSNPAITKDELIKVIYDERLRELFGEFGQRWFDAKRTSADLSTFFEGRKPGIVATDALLPIPDRELKFNKNLVQNEGYK